MFEYLLKECLNDEEYKPRLHIINRGVAIFLTLTSAILAVFFVLIIIYFIKFGKDYTQFNDEMLLLYAIILIISIVYFIKSSKNENDALDKQIHKMSCVIKHISKINRKAATCFGKVSLVAIILEAEELVKPKKHSFFQSEMITGFVVSAVTLILSRFINQSNASVFIVFVIFFGLIFILISFVKLLCNFINPFYDINERIRFIRLLKLINDCEIDSQKNETGIDRLVRKFFPKIELIIEK
jgi:predicted PurR-regulated permease PerM